jgi:hypothetical protein
VGVDGVRVPGLQGPAARDHQYDLLAQHFEAHADIAALMAFLGIKEKK